MKFFYSDKKERIWPCLRSGHWRWAVVAVITFLSLPLWRESIAGRCSLEAGDRAVIRTQVPGKVTDVYVKEGQAVSQGGPVARLVNLALESKQSQKAAEFSRASAEVNAAELRYGDTGLALTRRDLLAQQSQAVASEAAELVLKSPIAGVVTTPRVTDLAGSFVKDGTEVAEVADIRTMRVRIYVSEYDMHKYRPDSSGRLQVDGILGKWDAGKVQASRVSSEIPPELIDVSKFKGMRPPTFYEMTLFVSNPDGRLKPGMVGTARIYGQHRSLAGFAYQEIAAFLSRKVW